MIGPASALAAYAALSDLVTPFAAPLLRRRARAGKEDPARLEERLGRPGRERPPGPLVWAHAASVGESLALLPLLAEIAQRTPPLALLVTTGTVTSARMMAERLPPQAFHQYAPLDLRRAVRRFFEHWQPGLAIFVESEIWPNLLTEAGRRSIPLILVNGRISPASYRGWRRSGRIGRALFRRFALVLAQDETQARQFLELGAARVEAAGDLKAAAPPLPVDPGALAEWRRQLGTRPTWLAASTHEGEEAVVLEAHRRLALRFPSLLTLLAPRHPVRADAIATRIAEAGIALSRQSQGEAITDRAGIHLIDALGLLGLYYRLAPVVLVGGSLDPGRNIGGHNPLEAAILGCAILHGPDMRNAAAATAALDAGGGAAVVAGPEALAQTLEALLLDPAAAAAMGARAKAIAEARRGVLETAMAALEPWLATLGPTSR